MIRVSIAKSQIDALRRDGTLSVEWLAVLAKPVEKRRSGITEMWSIEATPEMWDELLLWCYRRSSVPAGASGAAEKFAVTVGRVQAKVNESLHRMSLHPGYRHRAIKAHSAVVLPAYRCKHPRARWWPTPRMAVQNAEGDSLEMESGWLVPEQKMVRGSLVTKWRIDANHPSYYADPTIPTTKENADD